MRKIFLLLISCIIISCRSDGTYSGNKIITVSIAPFKFFVTEIAGTDFTVNIMVPPGADPQTYEPIPEQINKLRKSVAYICNGYLGFEMNWLERFYETNLVRKDNIKTKFVQREYDTKNAKAIAGEIGAKLILIDPLSEDWQKSTTDVIEALYKSLAESSQ